MISHYLSNVSEEMIKEDDEDGPFQTKAPSPSNGLLSDSRRHSDQRLQKTMTSADLSKREQSPAVVSPIASTTKINAGGSGSGGAGDDGGRRCRRGRVMVVMPCFF